MIVEEHMVVTVAYQLRRDNLKGEILEIMNNKWPFTFLFGAGKLLPKFEENLYGLSEGDTFSFSLTPEEAYGDREAGNILTLPTEVFQQAGGNEIVQVRKGNFVTLTDDEGLSHNGIIETYTDTSVTVDFNHAMAGLTLFFEGVILHIRKASIDELIRQHYIPETGTHRQSA